jgi:hypothetical protein
LENEYCTTKSSEIKLDYYNRAELVPRSILLGKLKFLSKTKKPVSFSLYSSAEQGLGLLSQAGSISSSNNVGSSPILSK